MPFPGIGGASFVAGRGPKVMRLALHGHSNRPFFHIVLTNLYVSRDSPPVEQLGTYDPMPNKENQKLLSLNIERTRYWMGQGAYFSPSLQQLLGLVGFLPIHPRTYKTAWRTRHKESLLEAEAKSAKDSSTGGSNQPSSSAS